MLKGEKTAEKHEQKEKEREREREREKERKQLRSHPDWRRCVSVYCDVRSGYKGNAIDFVVETRKQSGSTVVKG